MVDFDRSRDDFTLFRRNRRSLRISLMLLAALFALAIVALLAPPSGELLAWASEVLDQLFT